MKTVKKVLAFALVSALIGISMLGCNTFRGAGKDIQRGGQAVEEAAIEVQQN